MAWSILNADARHIPLADESVQCVVTSPPYWGLRDFGNSGEQIGLEPTPELFVKNIVAVFTEVWRVLRDDGTCWVNLGDSYASAPAGNFGPNMPKPADGGAYRENKPRVNYGALKMKDLCGIPWRVAFALQAAGWYLRSDIIWSKPNPMPESVTDRPTKAHEYIFLLSKNERYFFDQDAVREAAEYGRRDWQGADQHTAYMRSRDNLESRGARYTPNGYTTGSDPSAGRNIRTVWEIATQPYAEAHFATFPQELAERCIKAGTSEKGCCSACGKAWERVTEQKPALASDGKTCLRCNKNHGKPKSQTEYTEHMAGNYAVERFVCNDTNTIGFQPGCKCAAPTRPCVVLDPFGGAGTVPLVADKLNRRGVGLELKPDYCKMAKLRCFDDAPLFAL
jgi:DNA modification methylase